MTLWAAGRNREGQLVIGREEAAFTTPCKIATLSDEDEVSHVACGKNFTVILLSDGSVLSGGENHCGQLGHGTDQPTEVFSPRDYQTMKSILESHRAGEGSNLYTYHKQRPAAMDTMHGQPHIHGDMSGYSASVNFPRTIDALAGRTALMVACGAQHTLVLASGPSGNQVWAFGSNVDGELGLGAGELGRGTRCHHLSVPMMVSTLVGKDVKSVTCGETFSLAVTRRGVLYSWGNNTYGQLALGHTKNTDVPHNSPWLAQDKCYQAAAGAFHSLLLCTSAKVFSAGRNHNGLLGTGLRGGPACWPTPQLVEPLLGKNISSVHCGVAHSAALGLEKRSGRRRVYTWGNNSHGQLGLGGVALGADVLRAKPVEFLLNKDVAAVACGSFHTVAITSGNQLMAWGDNRHGQLGVSTVKTHPVGDIPLQVAHPATGPKLVSVDSPLFSMETLSRTASASTRGSTPGSAGSKPGSAGTSGSMGLAPTARQGLDAGSGAGVQTLTSVQNLGADFFRSTESAGSAGVFDRDLSSGSLLVAGGGGAVDGAEQEVGVEEEDEESEDMFGGVLGAEEGLCVWAGGSHTVFGLRRRLQVERDAGGGARVLTVHGRTFENDVDSLGRGPPGAMLAGLTEVEEDFDSMANLGSTTRTRAAMLEF